jgi:hypothetical protein
MNVGKAMAKVELAKTLGKRYAEQAREADKQELLQQGAKEALEYAARAVGDLGVKLDKALEDGELTPDMMKDPKQVEIFIKRWNKRAVGALDNLATTAEIARRDAIGRARGLRAAEEGAKKEAQAETARLVALQQAIDSGEITIEEVEAGTALPGEPGGHPGLPLKHQREDEKAQAEPPSDPPPAKEKAPPKKKAAPKKRPKKKPQPKKKAAK